MNNSVYSLFETYGKNKGKIENYFKLKENYGLVRAEAEGGAILGMTVGIFLIFFIIVVGIWIWAIVVLIKYWKELPTWAQVVGFIGVLPIIPVIGPVATLISVYATKPVSHS